MTPLGTVGAVLLCLFALLLLLAILAAALHDLYGSGRHR